tara:strand:- start:566 stop:871 length:306 start_codon:yes stop_codon:yes gene_type:complete
MEFIAFMTEYSTNCSYILYYFCNSALLGANPHEGESGGGGGAAGGKPKSKYAKKKKKEIVKKAVPETELSSAAARVAEMERLEAEHAATGENAVFFMVSYD